jgi:hypothetical protein
MHDENSFMVSFAKLDKQNGHKHKIHKSLLMYRKILIFGSSVLDFIRSQVGIHFPGNSKLTCLKSFIIAALTNWIGQWA